MEVRGARRDDSTRDAVRATSYTATGSGCFRRQGVCARQTVQNGALRPIVPVTAVHEVFECRLHRPQHRHLLLQFPDVRLGKGLGLATRCEESRVDRLGAVQLSTVTSSHQPVKTAKCRP